MLSQQDNELVTNINPGTPMGELFRRFWLPVALSEELPGADCVPIRVKVLGEDLIAIRDTDGRPGLFDAYCPHRGAPMFFGRNEESGLRCVYHGWKFDVDGKCTDIPNAPEGPTFKDKIKIKCYPCVDKGDLIWAYMGPAEKQPPFPGFEWCDLPKSHRYVMKFIEQCNYLQAMEGDYDPSHARFLHSRLDAFGNSDPSEAFPRAVGDRRFRTDDPRSPTRAILQDHEQAMLLVQVDNQPDGKVKASVDARWTMPIFCPPGAGSAERGHFACNMRVPIDNETLMFFRLRWSWSPISEVDLQEYKYGGWTHPELIPGTRMPKANLQNDYLVDRVAQKNFTYTGIKTFPLQDIALIEAQWGPIAKRELEHLVSTDFMMIYVRRRLLKAVKDLQNGIEPAGPFHPEVYRMHHESAVADTAEAAIAAAKEKALRPLLPEKLPELAQAIRA